MANPIRTSEPSSSNPVNPTGILGADPLQVNARTDRTNAGDRPVAVSQRSGGTGILIAAVIVVLAIAAYVMFSPGSERTAAPNDPAVSSEPATPAPSDSAAPSPDATAPTAPADSAPVAPESSSPAPAEDAPVETAPVKPAPAPVAPAQ